MMNKECWVWLEHREGQLVEVAKELLGKAQDFKKELGVKICGVLIGKDCSNLAYDAERHGAEKVYIIEGDGVALYSGEAFSYIFHQLALKNLPEIVLFGATTAGTELGARVAAKLRTGLTAHCIDFSAEEIKGQKVLVQVVPGWGANAIVKIAIPEKRPQMATVKTGIFSASPREATGNVELVRIAAEEILQGVSFRTRPLEIELLEKDKGIALEEAKIVIGAGWGVNSKECFEKLQELGELLYAGIGGTRPVVDAGWLPEDKMIGVSGKTIKPQLFISAAASGAPHFTTGFSDAGYVVAINSDREAPIFEISDLGIVGPVEEIIPEMIEQLRLLKEKM